jgi:hypothetical protein
MRLKKERKKKAERTENHFLFVPAGTDGGLNAGTDTGRQAFRNHGNKVKSSN